jgi:hypothetical protein
MIWAQEDCKILTFRPIMPPFPALTYVPALQGPYPHLPSCRPRFRTLRPVMLPSPRWRSSSPPRYASLLPTTCWCSCAIMLIACVHVVQVPLGAKLVVGAVAGVVGTCAIYPLGAFSADFVP